ncbi:NAD(P)H-dependent oxidoreductase [Streptomyces sp. PR69]|uniref:NADPH-dependent FMN reductase n=1 Tax=Streptomyces sp. PR69 TaxID=2984950 RepID=UPI002B276CFD|nr:NAD(P)H-dependent oxidoreductase [Streptomyces sp. PR69]
MGARQDVPGAFGAVGVPRDVVQSVPGDGHGPPLRVFVLSGSSRKGSFNGRLAMLTARLVTENGAAADLAWLRDFDMPSYDGDAETAQGQPPSSVALRDRLRAAQAIVFASPEYNASVPGVVKNAIDWLSRFRPQPFKDKHALLVSASPSMVGGNRGLWALRVPLEHLGARVYPDMFSLAKAHQAFDDSGDLNDAGLRERLDATVKAFLGLVEADTHYPALRRCWYEFLGDRTSAPVTQRAEE